MAAEPDLQPTLIGPRVTVRPLRADDWATLFAAAADPRIWALHPTPQRYREGVFRSYFDGGIASGSAFVFLDRAAERVFGSSRYHGYSSAAREIEIGWTFLSRAYWGGSYNLEVKSLMLEHAFGFVERVVFWVGVANWRSRRAMEKIGGRARPGTHTREIGGATPHVVYEIDKSVWANRARLSQSLTSTSA